MSDFNVAFFENLKFVFNWGSKMVFAAHEEEMINLQPGRESFWFLIA